MTKIGCDHPWDGEMVEVDNIFPFFLFKVYNLQGNLSNVNSNLITFYAVFALLLVLKICHPRSHLIAVRDGRISCEVM